MRWLLAAALVIALAGRASEAFAYTCSDNHYVNSSGHWVHQEAVCRDGSVSFSEHRRGTCSHHGGVEHWE